jgi:splicing factor 3A subunit 2
MLRMRLHYQHCMCFSRSCHTSHSHHSFPLSRTSLSYPAFSPLLLAIFSGGHQRKITPLKTVKIGRPGYRVTKQRDPETAQLSLLFQIDYPEIEEGLQPRHRFMSAYEQKIDTPDKNYQYLLFAAAPYEVREQRGRSRGGGKR